MWPPSHRLSLKGRGNKKKERHRGTAFIFYNIFTYWKGGRWRMRRPGSGGADMKRKKPHKLAAFALTGHATCMAGSTPVNKLQKYTGMYIFC